MTSVTEHDWYAWYHDYDDPATPLARRLAAVQERIRAALDAARPGPLRAISVCAGQGRDLIGALAGHPRQHDVRARLVEIDPRNADVARQAARAFAGRLADRQSLMIPAEDPDYGDLGPGLPALASASQGRHPATAQA
jgi:hypothetical protein